MGIDRNDPNRGVPLAFLDTVSSWIMESGEVFVILRHLAAAGAKDYAFCRTFAEFERLVGEARRGTDIEVFRKPQLPIRGTVTKSFIAEVLGAFTVDQQFMLVCDARKPDSVLSIYGEFGQVETYLRSELESCMGEVVAVGRCPDFLVPDNADLISASKGGIDGPR